MTLRQWTKDLRSLLKYSYASRLPSRTKVFPLVFSITNTNLTRGLKDVQIVDPLYPPFFDRDRIQAWSSSTISADDKDVKSFSKGSDSATLYSGNEPEPQLYHEDEDGDDWQSCNSDETSDGENDDTICLTPGLMKCTSSTLASHNAHVEAHNLHSQVALKDFFSRCSAETLEEFFVAATDAKNALSLRRSATLLDLDYWLHLKVLPLVRIYRKDEMLLQEIGKRILCLQNEVAMNNRRRIDLCGLDTRVPGSTRFHPSFKYSQRIRRANIESRAQSRRHSISGTRIFVDELLVSKTAQRTWSL